MMNVWEEKHNVEKPGAVHPLYKDIVSQDGQVGKVVPKGWFRVRNMAILTRSAVGGDLLVVTGGRVSQRAVFVVVGVKGRDAREAGGGLGGLGEILVAFEAHGNADFRLGRRIEGGGGLDDPQNVAAAAYGHALAQSDFGGHAEGELDFGAFGEGSTGEEEDSART
jgi:hypothetical protein